MIGSCHLRLVPSAYANFQSAFFSPRVIYGVFRGPEVTGDIFPTTVDSGSASLSADLPSCISVEPFASSAVCCGHSSLLSRRSHGGDLLWKLGFSTIGETVSVVPWAYLNQSKQKLEESHLLTIIVNKTTCRTRPFHWIFAEDIFFSLKGGNLILVFNKTGTYS